MNECPLTPAQLKVLQLLAEGLQYKQIAQRHNVTTSTVRTHLRNIYRLLKVSDRARVVLMAVQQGWIEPPISSSEPAERQTVRLAKATEGLIVALHEHSELTDTQRRYLKAFDDLLYARTDAQKIEARQAMKANLGMMLGEVPTDPVEQIVSALIDRTRRDRDAA